MAVCIDVESTSDRPQFYKRRLVSASSAKVPLFAHHCARKAERGCAISRELEGRSRRTEGSPFNSFSQLLCRREHQGPAPQRRNEGQLGLLTSTMPLLIHNEGAIFHP